MATSQKEVKFQEGDLVKSHISDVIAQVVQASKHSFMARVIYPTKSKERYKDIKIDWWLYLISYLVDYHQTK